MPPDALTKAAAETEAQDIWMEHLWSYTNIESPIRGWDASLGATEYWSYWSRSSRVLLGPCSSYVPTRLRHGRHLLFRSSKAFVWPSARSGDSLMAKKKRNVHMHMRVLSEERTDQLIFGTRGEPVLRLGETVREGERNGADITETVTDHVRTCAGSILSSSSLMPGPQQISVGICDLCDRQTRPSLFRRGGPKMTLSPAAEMQRCCNCAANLCAKHFRISRFDGRPRCRRCHRWHWLYKILVEPVFFIE